MNPKSTSSQGAGGPSRDDLLNSLKNSDEFVRLVLQSKLGREPTDEEVQQLKEKVDQYSSMSPEEKAKHDEVDPDTTVQDFFRNFGPG